MHVSSTADNGQQFAQAKSIGVRATLSFQLCDDRKSLCIKKINEKKKSSLGCHKTTIIYDFLFYRQHFFMDFQTEGHKT